MEEVRDPNHDFFTRSDVSIMWFSSLSLPLLIFLRWNLGVPRKEFLIDVIFARHGPDAEFIWLLLLPPDIKLLVDEVVDPIPPPVLAIESVIIDGGEYLLCSLLSLLFGATLVDEGLADADAVEAVDVSIPLFRSLEFCCRTARTCLAASARQAGSTGCV